MIKLVFRNLLRALRMKRDPVGYARSLGVKVGQECRLLAVTPATFGSEPYLVSLGDHVTVTSGVRFVTHDGGVWVFREQMKDIDVFGPIRIGDNVFIGINTIIFPGVTIGNNCVIGAGSLVTRDVPSETVAAGVPAKPIKTLEAYWNNISKKAVYIRSLPEKSKRDILQKRYL